MAQTPLTAISPLAPVQPPPPPPRPPPPLSAGCWLLAADYWLLITGCYLPLPRSCLLSPEPPLPATPPPPRPPNPVNPVNPVKIINPPPTAADCRLSLGTRFARLSPRSLWVARPSLRSAATAQRRRRQSESDANFANSATIAPSSKLPKFRIDGRNKIMI